MSHGATSRGRRAQGLPRQPRALSTLDALRTTADASAARPSVEDTCRMYASRCAGGSSGTQPLPTARAASSAASSWRSSAARSSPKMCGRCCDACCDVNTRKDTSRLHAVGEGRTESGRGGAARQGQLLPPLRVTLAAAIAKARSKAPAPPPPACPHAPVAGVGAAKSGRQPRQAVQGEQQLHSTTLHKQASRLAARQHRFKHAGCRGRAGCKRTSAARLAGSTGSTQRLASGQAPL